ncbi:MAG: polyamine aminopropyltransferase [Pseudomonadota bacterium]
MFKPRDPGLILKAAIFATGCAGIVAEFVLSTLAAYLTGKAVFQWTIVMSLMLFAMGLGSRLSRVFKDRLLDSFILVEFSLSLLCSSSAVLAYGLAGQVENISLFIYFVAVVIGGLIGLEIPLATRLNQSYEELRTNIANVMEKDYYGALLGGLFFAFFALPSLGLTYTPIVLGFINFLTASLLMWSFFHLTRRKKTLIAAFAGSLVILTSLVFLAQPIILYGEQRQYKDKIIYARQTKFQKIVITEFKRYYWLFMNGQEQFSTYDEEKYHEPLVHPALKIAADRSKVLILGGGDGLALREVLKHHDVREITLVDLDPVMTELARTHPVLLEINQGAMLNPKVSVVNGDAGEFLKNDRDFYGVIMVDLPDPDSLELMHLYSESFYRLAARHLVPGGVLVTQAASPYFAPKAFLCINKTMRAAGFSVLPFHNQVPTMGEWGFVLGVKAGDLGEEALRERYLAQDYSDLSTRFLNNEAAEAMIRFGKGVFGPEKEAGIEVNTQANPVLQNYYGQGVWALY